MLGVWDPEKIGQSSAESGNTEVESLLHRDIGFKCAFLIVRHKII
jgi:hypothetical protein